MTRLATVALLLVLGVANVAQAQVARSQPPEWYDLPMTGMERVGVDRGSLREAGTIRRVHLRWHFVATAGRHASYTVDDTEIDCAREQGRIRGRRTVLITLHTGRTEHPADVSPAEAAWHSYGPGSVAREAWQRVCELPMPAA